MRAARFRQPSITRLTPHPNGKGVFIGAKRPTPFLYQANPQSYTVAASATLTVLVAQGVLANDVTTSGTPPFSAILYENVTAGVLTLAADGSFTYVAPATPQTQTFKYYIFDALSRRSNWTTVTITVT